MDESTQLKQVLSLALTLSPKARLQLIKQVTASIEEELSVVATEESPKIHWGQNLIRLLEQMGPIELAHPEIEDPVVWVKIIRREQEV